jgi:predicted polyphosphate/ATP-dependent NAD kinase
MSTVAIIANPVSGRDVRRLLANAARSTVADKVTIVRRVAIGAVEAGAKRLLVLPDPHGICRRALSTMHLDVEVVEIETPRTHDERETIVAAGIARDEGAGAVVILGGDGTNRVFSMGWPDAPLVPLSTGTNNVFPVQIEPTVAGAAAGLVASGALALADVARRVKAVRVDIDGDEDDIALVDAILTAETVVGSRVPFEPAMLRLAVLAIAEPAAVGMSPIGGLLQPVTRDEDAAVVVRFGEGRTLRVPISPGLYADVPVAGVERIGLGEVVDATGPGILAFDGDRRRVVGDGQAVRLRVERLGPRVIDVRAAMTAAAKAGVYITA